MCVCAKREYSVYRNVILNVCMSMYSCDRACMIVYVFVWAHEYSVLTAMKQYSSPATVENHSKIYKYYRRFTI